MQLGLEMLISHPGNDPTNWGVIQIFYNGQLFDNTTALNTAFFDTTSGLNTQQVTSLDINNSSWLASLCLRDSGILHLACSLSCPHIRVERDGAAQPQ